MIIDSTRRGSRHPGKQLPQIGDGGGLGFDVGACGLYGDAVECVFAGDDEHDQRDAAGGDAGEYGEYGAGLFGCAGIFVRGGWECCGGGGELCGLQRDGSEWECDWGLDGAGL